MAVPGKKASTRFSSSTIQIGSDEDLQVYCQPCHDEEGKILPAHGYCTDCKEHLCRACFTFHKKHKLSKHHTLLDASRMPKSLQHSATSTHTSQSDDLDTPCQTHPKETIKFYCDDHKVLLCSVCVTLEHIATSCKVNYIPDISGNIIDSKEYHDTLKAVDEVVDHYTNIIEEVKKMMDKSSNSLKDVLGDINNFRQEINKRLDELEAQATHAANAQKMENDHNIKMFETTYKDMTNSLKTLSDSIKQLNLAKQTDKLFMKLKLTEKTMKDVEESMRQVVSHDVEEHRFTPNERMTSVFETEESLGTLTQKMLNKTYPQSIQIKPKEFSYKSEIYVRSSEDENTCYITGMTVLSPDILIITDRHNIAVKMVDTNSQSVTDQLKLDEAPWDITSVTSTEVAVTIPENRKIQFISVSSNMLKVIRELKVCGKCYGISCYQDKLVVSFGDPATFKILDMKGNVLVTGCDGLICPLYIAANSSSIYVSDGMTASLLICNWHGQLIDSYNEIDEARGVALTDDGRIFLCCKAPRAIYEISESFSSVKRLLKSPAYPIAICWSAETRQLYYSSKARYVTNDSNLIKCYKLS